MKGIIVAMSEARVIGVDGKIPWHYPADLKRFKRLTTGKTIIMGRLTYESIGKALPNRRNIVISRAKIDAPGIETFATVDDALSTCHGEVWFVGGARIYEEAMSQVDLIDVMVVPDKVTVGVMFPAIDQARFELAESEAFEDDPRLQHQVYVRRRS